MNNAEEFLHKAAASNGRIVGTGDLLPLQVAEAREEDMIFILPDGQGFAIVPWDISTPKDRQREMRFFNAPGAE